MKELEKRRNGERKELNHRLTLERWGSSSESMANLHLEVQGVDISSGGIGISTMHTFRRGEVVKIEYALHGHDVTMPVYSEVAWCHSDNGNTRAGLRFLS
jgi:hypothetical protein